MALLPWEYKYLASVIQDATQNPQPNHQRTLESESIFEFFHSEPPPQWGSLSLVGGGVVVYLWLSWNS